MSVSKGRGGEADGRVKGQAFVVEEMRCESVVRSGFDLETWLIRITARGRDPCEEASR